MEKESKTNYYFVDEAGDLTFFNKKKQIILGKPGISKFFMVGVAQINNSDLLEQQLESLRSSLLKDPKYKDIPSMQPEKKKQLLHFMLKMTFLKLDLKFLKSYKVLIQKFL